MNFNISNNRAINSPFSFNNNLALETMLAISHTAASPHELLMEKGINEMRQHLYRKGGVGLLREEPSEFASQFVKLP